MKHLKKFESLRLDEINEESLHNILIDIIDDGFRVEGPYSKFNSSSIQFHIDKGYDYDYITYDLEGVNYYDNAKFKLNEIEDSLITLERYTGLKFKYLFEDEDYGTHEYNNLNDMLDSYDGYLITLIVTIY